MPLTRSFGISAGEHDSHFHHPQGFSQHPQPTATDHDVTIQSTCRHKLFYLTGTKTGVIGEPGDATS